jgi:hypothetical protein
MGKGEKGGDGGEKERENQFLIILFYQGLAALEYKTLK